MTSVHEPDTATPVTAPPEAAAPPPRRRRGRDTLVIVLVAVVCAVAAGAAVRQARGPALLVATAATDLRQGTRLDPSDLAWTEVRVGEDIAADVAVLAVGAADAGGIGASVWSVTLAVDDVTALAIAQALEGGSVHVTRATGAAPADVDLRVLGVGADADEPGGDGDPDG